MEDAQSHQPARADWESAGCKRDAPCDLAVVPTRYAERVNVKRISKIAGLSLAGFAAGAFAANKIDVGPFLSQAAGFAGAFIGTLVAQRRTRREEREKPPPDDEPRR